MRILLLLATVLFTACAASPAEDPPQQRWLSYFDHRGAGRGKHIVLIAAEHEYRSEEALSMLAQLLSKRHGFDCTVLFAQDPLTGEVDPGNEETIIGLELLDYADLVVLFSRHCRWEPDEMAHFDAYLRRGKPVVALRTSIHAFRAGPDRDGPFDHYAWDSPEPPGGFGSRVLGSTWVGEFGEPGVQSTRALPVSSDSENIHPILHGVEPIWCPTNLFATEPLPDDAQVLMLGKALEGMTPDSELAGGESYRPAEPVAWTREFELDSGSRMRIFNTTLGSGRGFQDENLRRLVINACYWAVRLEDSLPEEVDVRTVEWYQPSPSGVGRHLRGLQPVEMRRASRGVHRW